MLRAARADTLATFAAYQRSLPDLHVPQRPELNLPLWELGHIGWFQGWWTTRFPAWRAGHRADPAMARSPGPRSNADSLYDSSTVPHAQRWQLPLPRAEVTTQDLARQLDATLALLDSLTDGSDDSDDSLYFFRLALLHEDMHHEAALYMAHGLGIDIADPRWQAQALPAPPPTLRIDAGTVVMGRDAERHGFAFDNECGQRTEAVAAFDIDAQALCWDEFLPFLDRGYDDARCWTPPGWHWRQQQAPARVEQLQRRARPGFALAFISAHEAAAWCRWAGRRLPTEAEWRLAQQQSAQRFRWGDVWEWTASAFAPFDGFAPHPYRDYSAPWFDGRPVLKGASFMTQPRLADPRYRNYFPAERCDVPAGLRSVSL